MPRVIRAVTRPQGRRVREQVLCYLRAGAGRRGGARAGQVGEEALVSDAPYL